jgi:uncharacterized protein YdeI (YjbR/CyaY-like superfamily)
MPGARHRPSARGPARGARHLKVPGTGPGQGTSSAGERALPDVTFFQTPADFHRWLEVHDAGTPAVWIGFHRKASGTPSLTYPDALDEALCFGWIDGIRKRLDAERYTIRFTPRGHRSNWSSVNIRRVAELTRQGRMQPSGLAAFERRSQRTASPYSYENKPRRLPLELERVFRANRAAWEFFASRPPSYRRLAFFWVMDAVREATRLRRLRTLVDTSARGGRIDDAYRARRT